VIDPDLSVPVGIRGPVSDEALRACTVGATAAKPLRRGHRDPSLLLVLSEPADLGPEAVDTHVEVAVAVQRWQNGTRHLPIESPAGLAALVLEALEEVA
jgi:hypothetical protein